MVDPTCWGGFTVAVIWHPLFSYMDCLLISKLFALLLLSWSISLYKIHELLIIVIIDVDSDWLPVNVCYITVTHILFPYRTSGS